MPTEVVMASSWIGASGGKCFRRTVLPKNRSYNKNVHYWLAGPIGTECMHAGLRFMSQSTSVCFVDAIKSQCCRTLREFPQHCTSLQSQLTLLLKTLSGGLFWWWLKHIRAFAGLQFQFWSPELWTRFFLGSLFTTRRFFYLCLLWKCRANIYATCNLLQCFYTPCLPSYQVEKGWQSWNLLGWVLSLEPSENIPQNPRRYPILVNKNTGSPHATPNIQQSTTIDSTLRMIIIVT